MVKKAACRAHYNNELNKKDINYHFSAQAARRGVDNVSSEKSQNILILCPRT